MQKGHKMLSGTICKTIHQYNKEHVPDEEMKKLQEIADDCNCVKNYVYQRYGGVSSLSKIYPGYTVQNEMIKTGLREELGLPFVYFNLAVFDALGDIKSQWTRTKTAVSDRVNRNQGLTGEEKHYLRYLLKVSNAFEEVLNHKPVCLKAELQRQYDQVAEDVNTDRLDNYLRRQVRRLHVKVHSNIADGFSLTERAYRYGSGMSHGGICQGIYITMKEKRKRIFIPLTDSHQYVRQIYLKLYPEQGDIEIKVPVNVRIKKYQEHTRQVGISVGMHMMFMTDEGHIYGERLGEYQIELADWVRQQAIRYHPNNEAETGRKKYNAQKQRLTEQLHSYINMELNRFLKTEQPETIYIPKLPRPQKYGGNKAINNSMSMWQRGYIKNRLEQKCRERSVRIIEIFGKDISNECSQCGSLGSKKDGIFRCISCGYETGLKRNAAQNAKKRGMMSSKERSLEQPLR